MLIIGKILPIRKEEKEIKEIEIKSIEYQIETIGNTSKVKAKHLIRNDSEETYNISISFQLDDESAVVGYSFTNKNGEFISQLKEKEKAKEEQKDATTDGYSTSLMEQKKDNSFTISLGLVEKKSDVSFTIEYITKMDIDEDKLMIRIPKPITNKKLPISVEMKGTSSFTFRGEIEDEMEFEVDMKEDVIIMKDEDTDETIISSTFINKEKEGEVKVIFVCDRSGSMSGNKIVNLREMLQLFLRQLPVNSKFNIVSFGNRFEFMFNEMKEYNEEIMNEASKKVETFNADFGGTEMSNPLRKMIEDHIENTHIILLTDGEDFHKERVIETVKELSQRNIIHGVGLGRDCDMSLMKQSSRIGNGLSVHVIDPQALRKEVSRITQRILIPTIMNCQINWNIKGEQYPNEIPIFGGVLTCYLKTKEEIKEKEIIESQLEGNIKERKVVMKKEIEYNKEQERNDNLLHQLLAYQQIRKLEGEEKKEEAKKLSLRYSVLCKETAFIAIDKTTRNEVKEIKEIELNQKEEEEEYHPAMCNSILPKARPRVGAAPKMLMGCAAPRMMKRAAPMRCCAAPKMMMQEGASIKPGCSLSPSLAPMRFNVDSIEPGCRASLQKEKKAAPRRLKKCCDEEKCASPLKRRDSPKREDNSNEIFSEEKCRISKESKVIEKKQNKRDIFTEIIKLQKASGEFIGIEKIFSQINSISSQSISQSIIQTFFIIEVLKEHFKEFKTEWNLLVKKSSQWLQNQNSNIPSDLQNEIRSLISSLQF